MSPLHESPELEKSQYNASPTVSDFDKQPKGRLSEDNGIVDNVAVGQQNELHRSLKGRHMQMIAIGGAIGSGLFIGSGGSFVDGGPASVIIGFLAIGVMIYLMMQALAELAVMYPINGAFTMYICRFVDPSFGFACAWEYAISWLTVLPFEISAACNIIHYWPGSQGINNAAWITPLLVALVAIQYFGVRGYGEVEFVLSIIKITACIGFSILGIIINTGGVPTDDRGYIGNQYFNLPAEQNEPAVVMGFKNGFHGFCSVFVNAAFAYTGTELTGLAAAEAANPAKEIPRASKQVVWRILVFYVVNLVLVGLDVPARAAILTGDGPESRFSPFVIAIRLAGIKALPSIFNAVILLAVMSVANSCMFGSTRTVQALAANGMAPKFLAYVDRKGRPTAVIILQLLFGLLAYINLADNGGTIFDWLLALSGITVLFVFGSIAIAHIRFRMAWAHNGHSLDELPFRAVFGVWGSWICLLINVIALIASFYTALYPLGGTYLSAENFFMSYLAAPLLIFLYCCWKVYSWFVHPEHRPLYIKIKDIDIYSDMRESQRRVSGVDVSDEQRRSSIAEMEGAKGRKGVKGWVMAGVRNLI
ncbi:AAT family amino acid transporter [Hortaea werneckii]|nr:AAT family amino acid transporter [Hortaea werneckii]